MDLRQPFGLEFARIAHRSVVVAVKISAADGVRKPKINRGRAGWVRSKIRRETTAVASDWRSQSAASDLQAGGTDRNSACFQVLDRVYQTVRAISRCDKRAARSSRRGRQSNGRRRRNRADVSDHVSLAFIPTEEKYFISLDGPANGAAELLQVSGLLNLIVGIEIVAGIKRSVAPECECRARQCVRSSFQTNVHDRAWLPAIFGWRIFDQV